MTRTTQFLMAMATISCYASLFVEAGSYCGGFDLDDSGHGAISRLLVLLIYCPRLACSEQWAVGESPRQQNMGMWAPCVEVPAECTAAA